MERKIECLKGNHRFIEGFLQGGKENEFICRDCKISIVTNNFDKRGL